MDRDRGDRVSRLRRRCERHLRGIPIPQPFDLDAFCAVVAAHRGRPLSLQPMPGLSIGAPCGLWISVPTADYVFYDPETSRLHAEHIVLHELAHMLSGHSKTVARRESGDSELAGRGSARSGIDEGGLGSDGGQLSLSTAALARLAPDLDPRTVQTLLGRASYTTSQEREAEMLASLIRARAAAVAAADLPGRTLNRVADVLKFRP